MAGVVSVVFIAVCVLGVVRWRRRMKETAATKEKEGIWFVSMITIILQYDNYYIANSIVSLESSLKN